LEFALKDRQHSQPKYAEFWNDEPPVAELTDVLELVAKIRDLKAKGVTGALVAYSFERRIQPLQKRT
jgi:hypothetical protein